MEQPQTLASALEALASAQAENVRLALELEAFNKLSAEHSVVVEKMTELQGANAELATKLAEAEAKAQELECKSQDLETRANELAAAAIANTGVPPVAGPISTREPKDEEAEIRLKIAASNDPIEKAHLRKKLLK